MIHILYLNPQMTEEELINKYESFYGIDIRIEELIKGGYIEKVEKGFNATDKGTYITKIFSIITFFWNISESNNLK